MLLRKIEQMPFVSNEVTIYFAVILKIDSRALNSARQRCAFMDVLQLLCSEGYQ